MNYKKVLSAAILASVEAGEEILKVYRTDFEIEQKKDQSPLTLADKCSHETIVNYLCPFKIPILSEEGRSIDYEIRKEWQRLWIIDPLDGTKEFIKRNDEFTVNIALIENQAPVLGVIYLPVKDVLYFALQNVGSYKLNSAKTVLEKYRENKVQQSLDLYEQILPQIVSLPDDSLKKNIYTIAGSRSHSTRELEDFVAQKQRSLGKIEFISAGSSLKICLIAEGKADIYPRLGPTMEWDTAAGQAIAENSGASMTDWETGKTLLYNKENLLNPWFVVERK